MSSQNYTMTTRQHAAVASAKEQRQQPADHAHHEVAATLMTVAKGGAPAPASLFEIHRSDTNASTNSANNNTSPGARATDSSSPTNHYPPGHSFPSFTTLFSSIGFGIDLAGNATEACCKALRDATERGKLNTTPLTASLYQFYIQLGVPGLPAQSPGVPQNIDTARLAALLPPDIPKQFEVQCGGLLVPDSAGGGIERASCVVVASLTLKQKPPENQQQQAVGSPTSVTNSPSVAAPHASVSQTHYAPVVSAPSVPQVPSTWAEVEEQMQQQPPAQVNYQPVVVRQQQHGPTRNKSIEMLARISAEMIGREASRARSNSYDFSAMKNTAKDDDERNSLRPGSTNYKKLPPGTTPKNHKRLFVKHTYRDHSHEVPLPEELDLVGPKAPVRTPNAAFPLKLHEILSQIENDGHDDIIGWLPHGRSFKIHKQKEFVETILPNYFVMTKKSSFLRQLNLYGFNRLSQVGNDQGSYYHEKFLRGMKFLSRRMQRQKVNGNGIRAAGNPDEEPNLSRFPTCPPLPIQNLVRENAPSHEYLQLYQQAHEKAHHQHHHHHHLRDSRNGNKGSAAAAAVPVTRASARLISGGPASAALDSHHEEAALALHRMQDTNNNTNKNNETRQNNSISNNSNSGGGGGLQASFPLKLQRILDKLEAEGKTDVISWQSHGRAFIVHDPDRFVSELMPAWFNQTKYSSFQRQCHMYQFERITAGPDKNAYHNVNFLRGRPELAVKMQRTRVNGKGTRRPGNPLKEPDFYTLPPMPPIERGTVIVIPLECTTHGNGGAGDGGTGQEGSSVSGSGDENE